MPLAGLEGVELLIEPLPVALAGVDGTSDPSHHRTPKKRGPDYCAPVMWRAIAESERHVRPSIR